VLESIVVVFGLFSSIAGFVMFFAVPIWFIVQNPRVKKENVHMDHLEAGDVVVDPIIVGVLSMVTTTQRARALSNKIFGQEVLTNDPKDQVGRTLSFLKPRSLSIKVDDKGIEKIRHSSLLHSDLPIVEDLLTGDV
jgi:hypothetical protein